VALVTGGGRGIGRAICLKMAGLKATLIVNYSKSEDAAREIADKIDSEGGKAVISKFDVSDPDEVSSAVKELAGELGRIDILVNNAGITKDGLLLRMKDDDFARVTDVNLKGTFNCIRSVARYMVKQRYGRIVNMSSVAGQSGNAGQINYCAAKAGILGLTKASAQELASRNITVNAVAPGLIETEMIKDMTQKARENIEESIPLGRLGTPDDIAAAICFLASDKAAYITGQVIGINGGMYM
jgi:3-oxoacyl-[acyl-carrier protein] reductase